MKWYKYFIGVIIVIVGIILFQLIPNCSGDDVRPIEDIGPLKEVIKEQKLEKDTAHQIAVKAVETVTVYVTKWRTLKPKLDSIPCPEALNEVMILTDSIVKVDSTAIKALQDEVLIGNMIIKNQDSVIKIDSANLVLKDKQIRKLKRHRRILIGVAGALVILSVVK